MREEKEEATALKLNRRKFLAGISTALVMPTQTSAVEAATDTELESFQHLINLVSQIDAHALSFDLSARMYRFNKQSDLAQHIEANNIFYIEYMLNDIAFAEHMNSLSPQDMNAILAFRDVVNHVANGDTDKAEKVIATQPTSLARNLSRTLKEVSNILQEFAEDPEWRFDSVWENAARLMYGKDSQREAMLFHFNPNHEYASLMQTQPVQIFSKILRAHLGSFSSDGSPPAHFRELLMQTISKSPVSGTLKKDLKECAKNILSEHFPDYKQPAKGDIEQDKTSYLSQDMKNYIGAVLSLGHATWIDDHLNNPEAGKLPPTGFSRENRF